MSALRKVREVRDKARDKAREGIRVINTRKTRSTSGRTGPPIPAPSYRQIKQTKAFNDILDDESADVFGLETEAKTNTLADDGVYDQPSSPSRNSEPDIFSDIKQPESGLHFQDDLFVDNFDDHSSSDTRNISEDLFSDDLVNTDETLIVDPPQSIAADLEEVVDGGNLPGGSPQSSSCPLPPTEDDITLEHQRELELNTVTEVESTKQENVLTIDEHVETISIDHVEEKSELNSEEDSTYTDPLEDTPTVHVSAVDSSPDPKQSQEPSLDRDELFPDDPPTEDHPLLHRPNPPVNTQRLGSPVSLSSSLEDDTSHLGLRDKRGRSVERGSDEEATSTAAILEELLSPKAPSNTHVSTPTHPLHVSSSSSPSKHLDSGVYDSDRGASEERFEIRDDYFSKETPHKAPIKKNSAGRLPPTRPPLSPSIRRKLEEKPSKKERLPADDLFINDFVVVRQPTTSKRSVSLSPQPARKQYQHITQQVLTQPPVLTQQQESKPKDVVVTHTQPKGRDRHVIEEPHLTLPYHLVLSIALYLYYTFNPWAYLSGLFTGFLLVYLLVGTLFVVYVDTQEQEKEESKEEKMIRPSKDFLRRLNTDFSKVSNYQSSEFTATLKYDPTTHHPRQRMKATVKLENDFFLSVKIVQDPDHALPFRSRDDLRGCTVTNVPEEVAKNRKRRWNKKFPICITQKSNNFKVFLFVSTSREKEDWFRRLRKAADGCTSEHVIKDLEEFFGYMENYFPSTSQKLRTKRPQRPLPPNTKTAKKQMASHGNRIHFSSRDTEDSLVEEEGKEMISITRESGPTVSRHSRIHTSTSSTPSTSGDQQSYTSPPSQDRDTVVSLLRASDTLWLNAVAARLCWDIWHDHRWKDWVRSRIQKMLARVKTPSFMEKLTLTDVDLGKDMPVVKRLCGGPNLDLRGLWVYLDVTYEGCFVMTITTKLKLGKTEEKEEQGQQMRVIKSKGTSLPVPSPHTKYPLRSGRSHSSAAKALGSSMDPYDDNDEIDSGSSDEETDSAALRKAIAAELEAVETPHEDHSSRKERLKSAVKKIGLSVGKKVVQSGIVQKAFEKASSYPLVLTVVVNRLDGVLAVNIPPPTTDIVWFGFTESPSLVLSAKPKLGHREVKMTKVTQWIENKLREVVKKKLVLPEMEDVCIKVLNSGMPEDVQKVLVDEDKK